MTAEGNSRDDVDILISGGAVDYVMEKLYQQTLDNEITHCCLEFNVSLSYRVREKINDGNEKERQKMQKRRIIDLFEERGFEDLSDSFHCASNIFDYERSME
ncbi:uncharacterized protein MONOS_7708 [Monocercomonoides exilis]|uniref:uncharacterized protein n=1 Tax=Monocercomonoides exilis TaxID=2049356 RepID=UPI00355A54B3|nr:hypothetical protein MONOS_7708 [Monocercomonoides exilis]|eukprot:MONOS_7708.1-p1 / transcript=MONOS_7708.1 / gene=MONOS_7708 / organism=Monocercomonoides_exilis_PA203 / gene_product=unspecified product / transcript_product=unspecified product / location=Mono_scaffold00270:46897-47256(-) / protein_length=102 / sequence_SO=supercontig / SO=protein_coding / is_pseudo=false